jgi:hypothetical protein
LEEIGLVELRESLWALVGGSRELGETYRGLRNGVNLAKCIKADGYLVSQKEVM